MIQSAPVSQVPRRSCCPTVEAWWVTPQGTLGATKAMRIWKTVTIVSLGHIIPPTPQNNWEWLYLYFSPHNTPSPLLLAFAHPAPSNQHQQLCFCHGALEKRHPPLTLLSLHFFSLLFPSFRHSVPSVPKSTCSWEGARLQTTNPPLNVGNMEGETCSGAQNCSNKNKLAAQLWTRVPC